MRPGEARRPRQREGPPQSARPGPSPAAGAGPPSGLGRLKKKDRETPWLDDLAEAIKPDWQLSRVAGRVNQEVKILREVAHLLSPKPDRKDRPQNAAEAETQMWDYLTELQRQTPRSGVSAKTARFVDELVERVGRYGAHLYHCFDDTRIPATTNGLEGYFGVGKRMVRKAVGAGSKSNSVVTNLGEEVLLALHQVRQAPK